MRLRCTIFVLSAWIVLTFTLAHAQVNPSGTPAAITPSPSTSSPTGSPPDTIAARVLACASCHGPQGEGTSEWVVPDGSLFVMGDHRQDSSDSRTFGPIEIGHVVGRAWLRYWPFAAFGVLERPEYGAAPT